MAVTALAPKADGLFDESAGYDEDVGIRLAVGLSAQEKHQAQALYRVFNELWGVCIVIGDPGTGKDTFGNYLAHTIQRYFPSKRLLRDERPRKLFGSFHGLFNEDVLREDIARMKQAAVGVGAAKIDAAMETVADSWVQGAGTVLLQNSILYLTEYWRYCYNREPHNPMNKTMGAIHKEKRHLNTLIIGTVQMASELDKKTCLPWVDWITYCNRQRANPTVFLYRVYRAKYDRRKDILLATGNPFRITVDAGKPRSFLGTGKIVVRKPSYVPETEEERVVLAVLKSGVDEYDQLVDYLETEGDMSEWETLRTLKQLALKLPNQGGKFVLTYPCWFGTFNSRSAPQIQTALKAPKSPGISD